jgi:CMP-N,N'-diacetyllegionaminic acid synthase
MKTIGIITARAGSKRLPGKNKKIFAGKPLVEWTIEAALRAQMLDRVLVSTDDWDIVDIAKRCGVHVPFIRPAELATDDTPHINVVIHALTEVGADNYTHCCLLQPTSPLRTEDDIDEACIRAAKYQDCSIISVTENQDYHFIMEKSLMGYLRRPAQGYHTHKNIPVHYFINGAIYVNPIKTLFRYGDFYAKKLMSYIMPKNRSLQIDDEFDFNVAEYVMLMKLEERSSD